MNFIDRVNATDRPEVTILQFVDDMVEQGARLIQPRSNNFKATIKGVRKDNMVEDDYFYSFDVGTNVAIGMWYEQKSDDMLPRLYYRCN